MEQASSGIVEIVPNESELSLSQALEKYQSLVSKIGDMVDEEAGYEETKTVNFERKFLKSRISEMLIDGFEHQDASNPNYAHLCSVVEEIRNKPVANGETLEQAVIDAYHHVSEVIDAVAYSDSRASLKDENPTALSTSQAEYSRLKDTIRAYLEPQNLVGKRNRREPSIFEAVVTSAELVTIRDEVIDKVVGGSDAVVVAGSLNWGMFFDTRGPGTKRSYVDGQYREGGEREQFTMKKGETNRIVRERLANEMSDVDIVIVADESENVRQVYEAVFKDKKDPKEALNKQIVARFDEMIRDDSIPEHDKPISMILDYVNDDGFSAQLIIFSNKGFRNMYSYDINSLEKQAKEGSPGSIPHVRTRVTLSDLETGEDEGEAEAMLFLHGNLDYKEGTREWLAAKSSKSGQFEQALIGGKRISGTYPTKPIGEAIPVDEANGTYGQYFVKYFPFGGFMEQGDSACGSYFLGFNTDNMILGKSVGKEETESSRIAEEYKFRYFRRIAMEQRLKNNRSTEDLRAASPDSIFGPYLSRWVRIPDHYRRKLFGEFRDFLERQIVADADYYIASLPDQESKAAIAEMQDVVQKLGLSSVKILESSYLHTTEFYFPSFDKLKAMLGPAGNELELGEFQDLYDRLANRSLKERSFTVVDSEALGPKAITLVMESDAHGEEYNEYIYREFIQFLHAHGIDEDGVHALFNDPKTNMKFNVPGERTIHVTIAKSLDEADRKRAVEALRAKAIGLTLSFAGNELRKSNF